MLRNQIAHGDAVDLDEEWSFDGYHHVRYAEEVLRRAIKRTIVIAVEEPLLEESRAIRRVARAYERWGAEHD